MLHCTKGIRDFLRKEISYHLWNTIDYKCDHGNYKPYYNGILHRKGLFQPEWVSSPRYYFGWYIGNKRVFYGDRVSKPTKTQDYCTVQ